MRIEKIKFKAKRLDDNSWVFGYFYEENGNTYIIENRQKETMLNKNLTYQVAPDTVCQFTGLKDNDGNGIYEHDIISIFEGREPCEVIFEKGCFIASNHVYGIHTALAKGIDYYDWKLCVISNKFDK